MTGMRIEDLAAQAWRADLERAASHRRLAARDAPAARERGRRLVAPLRWLVPVFPGRRA